MESVPKLYRSVIDEVLTEVRLALVRHGWDDETVAHKMHTMQQVTAANRKQAKGNRSREQRLRTRGFRAALQPDLCALVCFALALCLCLPRAVDRFVQKWEYKLGLS
jgi:hypothetical protein